ncbi:MAG TPA: CZB domain-containing protein [Thermodesulfovibrionia bacterium]|nr:CZB domain-containing protein [Thermodesulfovibrionia bacterium]
MGMKGWLMRLLSGGASDDATQESTTETVVDSLEEEAAGLNFKTAIEVHQKWKMRLRAVIDLNSQEALVPEVVSLDDQCALGKWIHGRGGLQFGRDTQFVELRQKHAYFHVCAGRVLKLAQGGQKAKATAELTTGDFARVSQEVIFDLAQMYTRLTK